MDEISKAWFSKCCEVDLLKIKGDEFQNFFSAVMEKSHSIDFVRVKPWGPLGDRKCDGYLSSKKLLFQVYAPDSMTLKAAEDKIDEDFTKALPFWGDDLQVWAFVHNGSQGISADILKKLETMKTAHPSKKIIPCGPDWLLREVMALDESHLNSLFGFSPNSKATMTALKKAGLIEGTATLYILSKSGKALAGKAQPVLQGEALRQHWNSRLTHSERVILDVLGKNHPRPLSYSKLASLSGFERDPATFTSTLTKLRSLGLVTGKRELALNPLLIA